MHEQITVEVSKLALNSFMPDCDDAYKLFIEIMDNFYKKNIVTVSFENVEIILPIFINISICILYRYYDDIFINSHLNIINIDKDTERLIPYQIKRAKGYYENPEYYDRVYKHMFGED